MYFMLPCRWVIKSTSQSSCHSGIPVLVAISTDRFDLRMICWETLPNSTLPAGVRFLPPTQIRSAQVDCDLNNKLRRLSLCVAQIVLDIRIIKDRYTTSVHQKDCVTYVGT